LLPDISLIVLRHGHAEHILEGVRNSLPPPKSPPKHLTLLGVEQVVSTAHHLGAKRAELVEVFSSPLPRTIETAEVFLASMPGSTSSLSHVIAEAQNVNKNDEHRKLNPSELAELQDLAGKTPLNINSDIIERNFGLCENTPILRGKPEDCYQQPDSSGKAKKFTAESDALIDQRVHTFLMLLKTKYCSGKSTSNGHYILVSTHDIAAKEILKELTGQAVDLEPGEARVVRLK
jgi:broad specificity phosphatase PhoE